ncbi:MAG: hypothetical protein ISS44_01305 [Candidatus Omnitrophica bacterium]|nr:hypothetical protein [Candidatus Omnitrophota bacterium]
MLVNKYQQNFLKKNFKLCTLCFLGLGTLIFAFYLIFAFWTCFAQDKISYDDKGRRDPFIALVTPDGRLLNLEPLGSETKIVLEGIFYDQDGYSYAIINDEVVSVGDYIQGFAVFKIKEDKVILLKDNKPIECVLEEEEQ